MENLTRQQRPMRAMVRTAEMLVILATLVLAACTHNPNMPVTVTVPASAVNPPPATAVDGRMVAPVGRLRVDPQGGWRATWPGVHWTLRFSGSAVGVEVDDPLGHWVLEIDGRAALHIAPQADATQRTAWVRDLPPGEHTAVLIKRGESPQHAVRFVGFHLEANGRALPPPPQPLRKIEFIGDSFTAAMGNMSTTRACTGPEIGARTDITQGFAVLAARSLQADWQIHAKSGAGLVRNWAGKLPDENFGLHYGKLLQTDTQATTPMATVTNALGDWQPQVVVIGLGINDFSTPVGPNEPRDAGALEREFVALYKRLIARLRQDYGDPVFVLLSLPLHQGDKLRPVVARLVAEERSAGHFKVHELDWGQLQVRGCAAHPDADDHRNMALRLIDTIRKAVAGWR